MNNFNGFPNNNFGGGFNQQAPAPAQMNQSAAPQGNNQGNNNGPVSLAVVTLTGRLTRDTESTVVNSGAKVATNSLAVNHFGGETDFWQLELWCNPGQNSGQHDFFVNNCKKGRHITVVGTPYLKRRVRQMNGQDVVDQYGKKVYDYYPTIRVQFIDGGAYQQSQNSNSQFQGQGQNGFANQPNGNQGGFNPPNPSGQPNFGSNGFAQPNMPNGNFGAAPNTSNMQPPFGPPVPSR